jgi:hypothetical protein
MQILSLVIALLSVIVAYMIYYENSTADVVIYAQVDRKRSTIINLVIHNIGKGIARDIKFICPDGIPKAAYGISGLNEPLKIYESGALSKGLPILFPDEKLVYSWGQFGGLKEALDGKPLEIEVIFFSRNSLQLRRRKTRNKLVIDIAAFEGVDISTTIFEQEVKKSLQAIAKSLEKMST